MNINGKSQRKKSRQKRLTGLCLSLFVVPVLMPLSASAKPYKAHTKHYKQSPYAQTQYGQAPNYQYGGQNQIVRYAQKRISVRMAKSIAKKKYPKAKVLDVFPSQGVYRVRLQRKDGHVLDVFIDAATGRVKG